MSFQTFEESARSGRPIDLFTFTSDVETLRYAMGQHSVTFDGEDYEAWEVDMSPTQQTGRFETQPISLQVRTNNELVRRFAASAPAIPYWLSVQRYHRDDGDEEAYTIWHGQVAGVKVNRGRAEIALEPAVAVFGRLALRRLYQQGCNHVLYDSLCGVDIEAFRHPATIATISSLTITSGNFAEKPDDWFKAGFIETRNGARRMVVTHAGSSITVLTPFADGDLSPGDEVDILAGCVHDFATCISKFGNEDNFGGFPFVPKVNVFEVGLK
jgi:hypothetical protein